MDRTALLELLREELKIEISTRAESGFYSKDYVINVRLLLGDDVISEQSDSINVESRDTSEQWRSPFS